MTDKLVIEALERLADAVDEMAGALLEHTDMAPDDLMLAREHMRAADNAILQLMGHGPLPIHATRPRRPRP